MNTFISTAYNAENAKTPDVGASEACGSCWSKNNIDGKNKGLPQLIIFSRSFSCKLSENYTKSVTYG